MPQGEALFTVKAPIQKVWDFLSHMKNVASCIPGCEVNIIDIDTSEWKLTAKAGFASKTLELKTRVTERIAAKRAAWKFHNAIGRCFIWLCCAQRSLI